MNTIVSTSVHHIDLAPSRAALQKGSKAAPDTLMLSGATEGPDRELVGRLVKALIMARDVIQKANELRRTGYELVDAIDDNASEGAGVNRKRLGRWIKGYVGQLVDSQKLVKSNVTLNTLTWAVVSVKSVVEVSAPEAGKSVINVQDSANASDTKIARGVDFHPKLTPFFHRKLTPPIAV